MLFSFFINDPYARHWISAVTFEVCSNYIQYNAAAPDMLVPAPLIRSCHTQKLKSITRQ